MSPFATINFKKWIDDNRHLLKPPVGNQQIWVGDDRQFMITVVGGPNSRTDYHYNEGEEFFYQIEGAMTLKLMQHGGPIDLQINEGEIFLLPPKVPHSPQRRANTVGLVIERKRRHPEEKDALMWFCPKCHHKLYDEWFLLTNIVKDFLPVINRFHADPNHAICKKCGTVLPKA